MKSSATIPTGNARRYMIQLCKHFGHRIPTRFDDREGEIDFEMGKARLLAASDTLMLVADAAEPTGLQRLEQVIESHLRRFAFREPELAIVWRPAG